MIPAVDVLGEGAVRLHQGDYDDVVERAEAPDRARPPLRGGRRATDPPGRPRRRPLGPRAPRARAPGRRDRAAGPGLGRHPLHRRRARAARRGRRPRRRRHGGVARPGAVAASSATRSWSRSTCATDRCAPPAGRNRPGSPSPPRSSTSRGGASSCTAIDRDGTLAGPDLELVAVAASAARACSPRAACARRPTSGRSPLPAPRPRSSAAPCWRSHSPICPTDRDAVPFGKTVF